MSKTTWTADIVARHCSTQSLNLASELADSPVVTSTTTITAEERPEDGYIAIMMALTLIPMMIFAALAVDVGGWYAQGHETQAAADAAALAGVPFLPNKMVATARAIEAASLNGYDDQPGCDGLPEDCNPTALPQVVVRQVGPRSLEVSIFTQGDVFFGQVVMDSITIERYAVAEHTEPIPLGNPTSAIGMGPDEVAGVTSNYWLRAVNDCGQRITGDFIGSRGSCLGFGNPNHRPEGHTFIVDVPTAMPYTVQARTTCAEFGTDEASAAMRFRFFDSDDTPFNDEDNVLRPHLAEVTLPRPSTAICPTDGSGWSPTNDPAPWVEIAHINSPGRYPLQALNSGKPGQRSLYSLRIVPTGSIASPTCSRVGLSGDSDCPVILPKDYLTIATFSEMFADPATGWAQLYLAEIAEAYAGETMLIELFDPADGVDSLQVIDPLGNYADLSWHTIDCRVFNYACHRMTDIASSDAPISQTCLGISCIRQEAGISFQDRTLVVQVDLPDDYQCARPPGEPPDCWWRVEYVDAGADIFETTTWGVSVTGDPVSLVE